MTRPTWAPLPIDVTRPAPARMYDYYLGGSHNFGADRQLADQVIAAIPEMPAIARANRSFLQRAVRHLVGCGVRQFLDIGSGMPTAGSVHEIVARTAAPMSRVVYVDKDPVAATSGDQLLADHPSATMLIGDLRCPVVILGGAAETLLLDRPIGLLLVSVLQFLPDLDDPYATVRYLRDALAPGSYLVLSHPVTLPEGQPEVDEVKALYQQTSTPDTQPRTAAEVARFFDGWRPVEPGLGWINEWRPEWPEAVPAAAGRGWSRMLGGVARLGEPVEPSDDPFGLRRA